MTWFEQVSEEPFRYDFYDTLRRLERGNPDQPRIGESTARKDEYALLGQDPFTNFPASNLALAGKDQQGRHKIHAKFLGMLGPQGALPMATTEEALHWFDMRDDSFARFLDVFHHRFLQLFFRAWANPRPIAQHDRPDVDRFADYVGSAIGIGTQPLHNQDSVRDLAKLSFAGLLAPQAKSASRLRRYIMGLFDVECEVDEFVGGWLMFERQDQIRLGRRLTSLGDDCLVGAGAYSVQDKIRIRLFARNLDKYGTFLPTGIHCEQLADAIFFYLGEQIDYDIELAIPSEETRGVRLNIFGQLGWTTWITPDPDQPARVRTDARFHPASRMALKRRKEKQNETPEQRRERQLEAHLRKPVRFAPRIATAVEALAKPKPLNLPTSESEPEKPAEQTPDAALTIDAQNDQSGVTGQTADHSVAATSEPWVLPAEEQPQGPDLITPEPSSSASHFEQVPGQEESDLPAESLSLEPEPGPEPHPGPEPGPGPGPDQDIESPNPEWQKAQATVVAALLQNPFEDAPEVPSDETIVGALSQSQDDPWSMPLATEAETPEQETQDSWTQSGTVVTLRGDDEKPNENNKPIDPIERGDPEDGHQS